MLLLRVAASAATCTASRARSPGGVNPPSPRFPLNRRCVRDRGRSTASASCPPQLFARELGLPNASNGRDGVRGSFVGSLPERCRCALALLFRARLNARRVSWHQ
jgi:hypothetical protein